jgi:hypothetical protein
MIAIRIAALAAVAGFGLSFGLPAAAAPISVPPLPPSADVVLVQARPQAAPQAPNARHDTQAQIYFVRGLANVFSRGMDEMGARLRPYGFAPHVMNHRGSQNAADTIARNYRAGRRSPVILVGHSLGANAVVRMAKRLQTKGVPVAYLATFDPTHSLTVPSNVQSFVNFYQNNGHGRPAVFPANRGDDKVNLNLTNSPGMTHTNIDQSERLQNIVIGRILEITAR